MPEKLVAVASFTTPVEAELAKNHLETEGISARLANDSTVGWFWYISNAVGGIQLLVGEEQAERALAILESAPGGQDIPGSGESEEATWTCERCGAQVSAELEYCPCGEVDAENRSDPAGPSLAEPRGATGDARDQLETSPGDEMATRALRAAILGLLLCPPLLQIYSVWILIRLISYQGDVSPAGVRNGYVAMIIDALVFMAALIFVRSFSA